MEQRNAYRILGDSCCDDTAEPGALDFLTRVPLTIELGGEDAKIIFFGGALEERMNAYESQIIRDSFRRCRTTVAVAKELGISQATAARKIAKYVKGREE